MRTDEPKERSDPMPDDPVTLRREVELLRAQVAELRSRLHEPEEIIRAIRQGEVDSFVVNDATGEQIYSLRSADVLFRVMVEDIRQGAVALDENGLILCANRYFAGLVDVERTALVGTSIFPFVPEESRPFFQILGASMNLDTARSELVLQAVGGRNVAVHASLNEILLDGNPIFCLLVTDMTEEKCREELLTESHRKDAFLAMLAHELRNPVAPIKNAVHVLDITGINDPTVIWAKDVIDRQASQLSRLVDDLMDVSRITRGKIRLDLRTIDLLTVITRGVETAQPALEAKRHVLSVSVPTRPLLTRGDPTRLSQVVSNLLSNAAKFTPEGGHVTVTAERIDHQGDLGDEARVSVRDDGLGIQPAMLTRIFDAFVQADTTLERSEGGLGIGLALVRSVVEMHGGRVWAHSDGPGKGSELVFTLPVLPSTAREESASPARLTRATARRVLVVDDNLDAAESLSVLLRLLGHEVEMVTQGSVVLETARSVRPEVVFLDISLPDVSGYDLCLQLRASPELEGVCLVALTGYGQDDHRARSREAGFDHHWVKPLDFGKLERLFASMDEAPSH